MNDLPGKQTILIVDDSPENITILGTLLRSEFTVRVANNGEKALKILEASPLPDLILLDVVMPGIDGYEVCRRLKRSRLTKNIPIIFITARSAEEDEIKGFELGAVDYVTKPFNPVIVMARVRMHTELKRYRDFLEKTSYDDSLTAIPNRRRFEEFYGYAWNVSVREASPLSLIMIDVDRFKAFNDNYGHPAGDVCLVRIAQKLSATLKRKTDLIARYGGEEFACVLPKTGMEGARFIATELREGIRSLNIPHGFSSVGSLITISQGVSSVVPTKDMTPEKMISASDEALYRSKADGGDSINYMELF